MNKKMRKKTLAGFMTAAMVFSMFTIPVLAEEEESGAYISLVSTADSTEAASGDTFTVTVTLEENTGFVAFLAALDYDSDLLTLTGFSYADTFSGWAATADEMLAGAKMAWSTSDSDTTLTGELATMTFTVNDGVYNETAEVGLDMSDSYSCFDNDFTELEIRQTKAEISIVCSHEWDDGVVTKEATDTEAGEMTYTCQVCGETYTKEIEPTGETGQELQITSQPSDYTGEVGDT
ncbi:MAG: hypothetical protein LIO75_08045, partial [Lachnospiraceae bacterium]|nr:hypothetical protein [Lachnospiraceae bacterium]